GVDLPRLHASPSLGGTGDPKSVGSAAGRLRRPRGGPSPPRLDPAEGHPPLAEDFLGAQDRQRPLDQADAGRGGREAEQLSGALERDMDLDLAHRSFVTALRTYYWTCSSRSRVALRAASARTCFRCAAALRAGMILGSGFPWCHAALPFPSSRAMASATRGL